MPAHKKTLEQSFWEMTAKGDGCWVWVGQRKAGSHRYGIIRRGHRSVRAHRFSYELNVGPIPQGMMVCHRCDNPACVRPDHLFLGTAKDNSVDAVSKGRNMHVTKPWTLARGDRNGARTKPESVRRGEKIEWHKLTESDVAEIRRRYASGETAKDLARHYGVYFGTIHKAVYRHTWRHVA